jgi:C-terminal processing protease CtpA/Prc
LAALNQVVVLSPTHWRGIDASLLPAVTACADDPSAKIRSEAAIFIGLAWIQSVPTPLPLAVTVEEKLARDVDEGVRHDAVTAALERIRNKSDDVVDALIDVALHSNSNICAHAMFGLQNVDGKRLIPRLERYWSNVSRDPDAAAVAYALYVGAAGQEPPDARRLDGVGTFMVPVEVAGGYAREEVETELRRLVPPELSREWYLSKDGALWGGVVVRGVVNRRKLIALLQTSTVFTPYTDVHGWCDLVTPKDIAFARQRAAASATQPAPAGPETYAAAFQQLYDHLGAVYPNFKMKGIDWKAVGEELLSRSRQVRTQHDFGLLVEELVARLQDSHAQVLPGTADPPNPDMPQWDPGVHCLTDDRGRPVVYYIEPHSSAQKAGVKPGMTIVSVNGVAAEQAIGERIRLIERYFGESSERVARYDATCAFLCQPRQGATVHLTLEDPDGKQSSIELIADEREGYLPRQPVERREIDDSADMSWTRLSNGIGYIYVRRIPNGLEKLLDTALHDLGPMTGLVIDVRGNSGGGFDEQTAVRNFDLAPGNVSEPDRPRYKGPIAMLIDERTISAGEGWTSWFIAHHRATLFGCTTAGASSRKEQYTLSNGLYKFIIPIEAYTGFLDRPIERRGLEPDVPVRCTARDLADGRDTVLETATQWLAKPPRN